MQGTATPTTPNFPYPAPSPETARAPAPANTDLEPIRAALPGSLSPSAGDLAGDGTKGGCGGSLGAAAEPWLSAGRGGLGTLIRQPRSGAGREEGRKEGEPQRLK